MAFASAPAVAFVAETSAFPKPCDIGLRAWPSLNCSPGVFKRHPVSFWREAFASAPAFVFAAQTSAFPNPCDIGLRTDPPGLALGAVSSRPPP